jgi:hypothetical protein
MTAGDCRHCRPGELCEEHWCARVYLVRVRLAQLDAARKPTIIGDDDELCGRS